MTRKDSRGWKEDERAAGEVREVRLWEVFVLVVYYNFSLLQSMECLLLFQVASVSGSKLVKQSVLSHESRLQMPRGVGRSSADGTSWQLCLGSGSWMLCSSEGV